MRLILKVMRCLICLVLMCVDGTLCLAQTSFTSRFWHVTDGLPSEMVQALAQTPDRYLWIGTAAGLLRFDGAKFSLYNHQNTPELTSDKISSLLASADGTLWIGTETSGVLRYRGGQFQRFGAANGLTDNVILSFFEDRQHKLWVGTNGGVFAWTGERFQPMGAHAGIPARTTFALIRDVHGSLWLGGTSLVRSNGSTQEEFPLKTQTGSPHVLSLLEGDDGVIWAGTTAGLYRSTAQGPFAPVAPVGRTVRALKQTSDGTLWIGTVGEGMYVLRRGSTMPERFSAGLSNQAILSISEDAEANLWVGTEAGLQRLSRIPGNIVPIADASSSDFGSLMLDHDGTLWMCSTGLFRMRDGVFVREEIPALRGTLVRTLTRDRDGSLWVGTEGKGLLRLSREGNVDNSFHAKLINNKIRAVLQATDNSLWVGTDSGVSHITPAGIFNQRSVNGHGAAVMAMLEDRAGDIWVGTYYGLLHLHDGRPVEDAITTTMGQRNIWSLHQSDDGRLWIGTNDGLYLATASTLRHIGHDEGLPSSPIYQILEGADKRIWLSSPSGVTVLDRASFHELGTESHALLPLTWFNIAEDFEPAELFGSVQSAGLMTPAGDVWFPSTRGAVHILPNLPVASRPFPLRIAEVLVDGRSVAPDGKLTLPAGSTHLAIDYAPVLLSSQSAVRFRVKLEGFDKDWQEVSSQRTAYYTNLPPGSFTFRVAAFRVGDLKDASEVALTIFKEAPFYRKGWFLVLCLLFISALAYGVHQLRMSRERLRFQTLVEERSRVAREMHDTVIQGCTTISMLLETAASMDAGDHDSVRGLNELARKQIEATILEARQAVWNLRQGTPLQDDIESAIARIAQEAGEEFGKPVLFTRVGEGFPVAAWVTQELLMVIREAVHNALLHGHPTVVRVQLEFSPGELSIRTEDDGLGFNPAAELPARPGHFGIQGMYERINRIGAELIVESTPNEGTTVKIIAAAALCQEDRALEKV